MSQLHRLKKWVKAGQHPIAKLLQTNFYRLRNFEVPAVRIIYKPIRVIHLAVCATLGWLMRVLYWTPLFKTQLNSPAHKLYLYGGMPLVQGALNITMGESCRISGHTTFSARWASKEMPHLKLGHRVGIGWQVTIAVGSQVILGNDVRIAQGCFLAGYPGHPLDAKARAAGKPDLDCQVGDIILEDDVWLGTGVQVCKGVRIGEGTVVASGSIVTHDLPAGIIAAGSPAKEIKKISAQSSSSKLLKMERYL